MSDSLKFPKEISSIRAGFDKPVILCFVFFGSFILSPFLTVNVRFPMVALNELSRAYQNSSRCLWVCREFLFFGFMLRILTVVFSFKVNCSKFPHGRLSSR